MAVNVGEKYRQIKVITLGGYYFDKIGYEFEVESVNDNIVTCRGAGGIMGIDKTKFLEYFELVKPELINYADDYEMPWNDDEDCNCDCENCENYENEVEEEFCFNEIIDDVEEELDNALSALKRLYLEERERRINAEIKLNKILDFAKKA